MSRTSPPVLLVWTDNFPELMEAWASPLIRGVLGSRAEPSKARKSSNP